MKKVSLKHLMLVAPIALAFTSCSKDGDNAGGSQAAQGNYLVAGVFNSATYILTAESLGNADTITPVGNNGLELNNTYTVWANTSKGMAGFKYGQGGAHMFQSFTIGTDGKPVAYGGEQEIPNGLNTANTVDKYGMCIRYSQTLPDGTQGAVLNFYDLTKSGPSYTYNFTTDNFSDPALNGRSIQLQGICDLGNNKFMSALYTSGMSPDSVYVGEFTYEPDNNFRTTLTRVYKDTRISVASAGSGSMRYTFITKANNGDAYVFSAGNVTGTTKLPGALRIKSGATGFDASYHFDISEKSGGRRFRRVYPVSDDYVILEFYNDANISSGLYGRYAVLKMSTMEFNWITGLPAESSITAAGWGFSHEGKFYVGFTFADQLATIYAIDHLTHTAKRGLSVDGVTSIASLGFVQK